MRQCCCCRVSHSIDDEKEASGQKVVVVKPETARECGRCGFYWCAHLLYTLWLSECLSQYFKSVQVSSALWWLSFYTSVLLCSIHFSQFSLLRSSLLQEENYIIHK